MEFSFVAKTLYCGLHFPKGFLVEYKRKSENVKTESGFLNPSLTPPHTHTHPPHPTPQQYSPLRL